MDKDLRLKRSFDVFEKTFWMWDLNERFESKVTPRKVLSVTWVSLPRVVEICRLE